MFRRILVPLDGSTLSERAIPVAARIARASGATVVLLRVVSPRVEYGYGFYLMQIPSSMIENMVQTDLADATHYLESVAQAGDLTGVDTTTEVGSGSAAAMILHTVQEHHLDLVVMSSHGDTGLRRWILGSVAQKVARHASAPVLVLHDLSRQAEGDGPHPYIERPLRVLVPLDGSASAKAALVSAAQLVAALAAPGRGAIHLVRVMEPEGLHGGREDVDAITREAMLHKAKTSLRSITEHLREGIASELKIAVTWSVALDTDIAHAIIRVAENGEDAEGAGVFGGCDLIAMSTHGRGGLQRWDMGSVTERVLQGTRLPLLIVRPPRAESKIGVGEREEESMTAV
ncbi:MAG: universal stress protein [Ktedonobacteraceae bacterium]